jgi:hypothetical protein
LQQDGVLLLRLKKLGLGITRSCDSDVRKALNASFES